MSDPYADRSTLLYTAKDCGCLVLVMVNSARNLLDCAEDVALEARAGRVLHEVAPYALPPMECDEHRRQTAESASLMELGL